MRTPLVRLLPILLLLLSAGRAAAQDVMALVRADRWAEADAAAQQYTDPVARKLVTFYRLLAPGQASAAEIAGFMATSPDWPFQATLARRRDEALAAEPDDAVALVQCGQTPPHSAAALLRCAVAYTQAGRTADAATAARQAWIVAPADAAWEAAFPPLYAAALTDGDQWRRFDRLAWTDSAGAQRQLARLAPADQPRAAARLALRRDDPQAAALLDALPLAQRDDPGLMLEQAGWLRRAGQDDAALALWRSAGASAEAAAGPEHLASFWHARNLLARQLLLDGNAAGAYSVANDPAQTGAEQKADSEFLAGFIALRRLGDPATAIRQFHSLAAGSTAAITQGRAHYWLGRAAEAAGDAATSRAEYTKAAAWPETFYGQLAALNLGDSPAALNARILALHDPPADAEQGLALAGRELARAAAFLVAWDEPRRAQAFLLRLDAVAPDPADRTLAARLASGFGLPETAVAIARLAGRDGVVLINTGWPQPIAIPAADDSLEAALILGIIRQESSFDTTTVSPTGALGLMQLMPATAALVARGLDLTPSVPALVRDPDFNLRLGTAYLADLIGRFDGVVPLAVAAYNAGPNRVQAWLAANGTPNTAAASGPDIVDWIELIPFGETRNYVQRVIENEVIYRAKRGVSAAYPLAGLPQ
jgi:soluble lytic murein transglycosylase